MVYIRTYIHSLLFGMQNDAIRFSICALAKTEPKPKQSNLKSNRKRFRGLSGIPQPKQCICK